MLWSLIKIVLFVAVVAGLTFGAGFLLERTEGITIAFANTEFNLGPLQAVLVAVGLVLLVWLVLKVAGILVAFFRFLNGDETAISRYFDRNRERRGFEALSEGLMALASGEGRVALAKAAKAEKYLGRPELTNLISAQAAEMIGDSKKAAEVYKRLLKDDRTRFVGVRGIMKQKLDEGDTKTALKLAERAFALKPSHVETGDILLRLQAQGEDWKGARTTLNKKMNQGLLPRDVHKRRDAVLALSEAKEVLDSGNSIEAREAAIEANRLSPDLVPAAVMAANAYVEQEKPRYAARVLKKAWDAQPHPDLAAAFAAIAPDETPDARIKRFNGLTKSNPDHPESRMLMAELHLANQDYGAARSAISKVVEQLPTTRALAIMAAVERGDGGDDDLVRAWLTKALSASRGPQWVCDNCQTVHDAWHPVCSNCDGFDTLAWRVPADGGAVSAEIAQMLPLLDRKTVNDADISDAEIAIDAETLPDDDRTHN